ncbi:hypothetical protein BO70DRAFT_393695 [Aspergillus heteromorphus CBS 117.55]|uniref:Secreted protein n=1 Tax=Aspergillus heteromorphus CBS 117.55 TaxID=1448321 RepID=A0A317WRV4_9EURO|nr:uncharacterized protein BO70DRAFT_393695 [Aspergillus heteromorphus CBS 117.55]PWY89186.1 hypothetical protein BO70DRAFT_393695 [Aspergillus heteromorphus CBS 117.55]
MSPFSGFGLALVWSLATSSRLSETGCRMRKSQRPDPVGVPEGRAAASNQTERPIRFGRLVVRFALANWFFVLMGGGCGRIAAGDHYPIP